MSTTQMPANGSTPIAEEPRLDEPLELDPTRPQGDRLATPRRLLIWIALYTVPVSAATVPVLDTDLWWHLRVGQWVVQNRAVTTTDPFSIHGQGREWVAYSWLFEVLIYQLHQSFGLMGILLYRVMMSLAMVAGFHLLMRQFRLPFVVEGTLTGLAGIMCLNLVSERPWLFSILFSTLTLLAVHHLRQGGQSRLVWLLPACYALWSNLHIQFVHGLLLLGLACAAPILDSWLGWRFHASEKTGEPSNGSKLILLTVLCFLATWLNPYHVKLYRVVVEYASHTAAYELITELQPLKFQSLLEWGVVALLASAVVLLARRPSDSCFEILLLAAAAFFTLHSRRDLWLGVLASVYIWARRMKPAPNAEATLAVTGGRLLIVAVGVVLSIGYFLWERKINETSLQQQVVASYPVGAVEFITQNELPGPLFNHFNWGGFLIWALPQHPVALDGRTNLHGDERLMRLTRTWMAYPGWDQDPELIQARLILAQADQPLVSVLRLHPEFQIVYQDELAVVFVRKCQRR